MREEYIYRPPLFYIAIGMLFVIVSVIFGLAIGTDKFWFSIIMAALSIIALLIGIAFIRLFVRKFNIGKLVVGEDFIEIPIHIEYRVKLNFDDIVAIEELDIYDSILQISSKQGVHLIEQNWMRQQDFEELKKKLQLSLSSN